MNTFGPAYDEHADGARVRRQMDVIRDYMLRAGWRTLTEISRDLGYPESSVSAQLRHLRKKRFGAYRVPKRRRNEGGTWEHRVLAPQPKQAELPLEVPA